MADLIFISCQEEDFNSYGRRITARFREHFEKVFVNVFAPNSDLPVVPTFQTERSDRLQGSSVLLAIIGPNWDANTLLGGDIDFSLWRGIPVFPVLVGDAARPAPLGPLRQLLNRQWFKVSERDFAEDVEELISIVEMALRRKSGLVQSGFPAFAEHPLSMDQMVAATQACRRVSATAMNDGLGGVIVSPHNLEMVEREREPSRGPPHPEAASISRLDLGGRRWRRRAMWLAGALAITVGQGYALRHEFGALFDWVAGALWHGATLPAPSARPDTDVVDVIAFAPPSTSKGERFLVQVFLGKTAEDEDVTRVAALASDPTTSKRLVATLDVELAYGDRIDIKLEAANLSVEEPEQSLIWRGKPRSVAFVVRVSEDFMGDRAFVQVRVYRQAIPIGKIAFSILTEGHFGDISPVGELSRAYRRAFLSYASPDRPEVIKRAQALKAGKIDFFMDLLSLEPGERWEKRLYSEIDRCDLFVLFWSNEARNSPWVDREIRYALNCIKKHVSRNEARPEIYPIIIEGPPPPLPPDSLSHLQFNDPYLYLIASMEKLTSARPAN